MAILKDIAKELEYADVTIAGRRMLGTRFTFRGLAADDTLKASSDVIGIDPQSLGYFTLHMHKLKWETRTLAKREHDRKVTEAKEVHSRGHSNVSATLEEPKRLWDAKKVDEDSFSKDGITCAVGQAVLCWLCTSFANYADLWEVNPSNAQSSRKLALEVILGHQARLRQSRFHLPNDFIERTGIVPYPPPLHLYAWKDLTEHERKVALKELQVINKDHVHQALEAKNGSILEKHGKGRKIDEPKEWRAWSKMYGWERELAFETMKKAKRARERGEVQRQFENNRGEVISLIQDEPKQDVRSKSKKRALAVARIVVTDYHEMKMPEITKMVKSESKNPAPTAEDSDDEDLNKKREKARKLAEDIETEECLARMRREQLALEAEIEAAEKKKSSKK
ncbi:hypothetical protein BKA65DRAFT_485319 [Rhexocercosporidium sp. MPI-PUGE-AT-0058]|nr:hypothetical protein BKA65DRAFT_485319 [Rhexocercosporidium sp. MPI-PUGE-AT-0058]